MAEPKQNMQTLISQFRKQASSNRGRCDLGTDIVAEEFTRETKLSLVA